tara:strand:- start:49 stop:504 length:456 start_codon:yes stop_codon:yes gene_type:complete
MKIINVNSTKSVKTFNKISKKGNVMVAFVATWCGHCQNLKPIWKKMVKMMKKKGINGVIALVYSDFREQIDINTDCNGYPTIRLYKDGKIVNDFNGNWTQKDVLSKEANRFFKRRTKSLFKKKRTKSLFKKKRTKKKRKGKRKKMTRKRKR